jgi:hypothetical protein
MAHAQPDNCGCRVGEVRIAACIDFGSQCRPGVVEFLAGRHLRQLHVKLLDGATGQRLASLENVLGIAFSPDDDHCLSVGSIGHEPDERCDFLAGRPIPELPYMSNQYSFKAFCVGGDTR